MNTNLISQFNKWAGEDRNLIQKALSGASGANGAALIPQHLEQIVTNAVPRISPELSVLTPKYDPQSLHEYNQLTSLNAIGAAQGESSTTPTTQPTFSRKSVQLKVLKKKGSTTDFLRWSSAKNIDAAAANVEATLTSLVHDMCNYAKYGNALADQYEFSGWDTFISTNRIIEAQRGGAVVSSLGILDDMIDRNFDLQGMEHHKAFIMSSRMLSRFSQLLSNVRLNQGLTGTLSQVNIPGGWRLNAYRDIPIIVSGSDRPRSTTAANVIGAVTQTGTATSGGTIPDNATYYVQVAPITKDGEQLASAEVTITAGSSTGANTITIGWTSMPGAYRYKIYVSSTTATEVLKHVVPGFTYDITGTYTASQTTTVAGEMAYSSDVNGNVNSVTFLAPPTTAGAAVPSSMQTDIPYILGGSSYEPESVWLIDVDEFQGMGRIPFTNQGGSQFNGLISMEMLAKTDSQLPFLLQAYCAIAPSFEATSVLHRGLKIA